MMGKVVKSFEERLWDAERNVVEMQNEDAAECCGV
jgi:hypothetical protein